VGSLTITVVFEFGSGGAPQTVLIKLVVGIVDASASEIEADFVVLAHDLGESAGGLDDFELAVA
jgi:hypothetical protein